MLFLIPFENRFMLAQLEHWVVEISLENSLNIFSKGLIRNGYDRKIPSSFKTKSPINA
jgi:hypothetical protein